MTIGLVMVMEVVMVGSNGKVVMVVVMKVMVMIMLGLFEMDCLVRLDEACMNAHDVHLLWSGVRIVVSNESHSWKKTFT
jgi:hypothetical protein